MSCESFFCSQISWFQNYTHVWRFINFFVLHLNFLQSNQTHVLFFSFLINLLLQNLSHHPIHIVVLIFIFLRFLVTSNFNPYNLHHLDLHLMLQINLEIKIFINHIFSSTKINVFKIEPNLALSIFLCVFFIIFFFLQDGRQMALGPNSIWFVLYLLINNTNCTHNNMKITYKICCFKPFKVISKPYSHIFFITMTIPLFPRSILDFFNN